MLASTSMLYEKLQGTLFDNFILCLTVLTLNALDIVGKLNGNKKIKKLTALNKLKFSLIRLAYL